ncbi:MAG: extracellular solute-binding protein [Anaerolineae bacterium]|nr:extracellular solute-binding protein [Anaerolineae bacterium]
MLISKKFVMVFVVMALLALVAACGPAPTPETITVVETVEVIKEVQGETITVVETVEVIKEVVETVEVVKEVEVPAETGGGDTRILEVWDQFEYYGMTAAGPALEEIHAAWNEAHPDNFLSRSVFGGGWPIRNAVELALTSGEAPDVFYSWPSGAGLTAYAREGFLLDLTPYADKYGWWDRLPEWALERNMFDGKLYAYPWEQDLEYVYYNTRIFDELGLEEPQSFEDVLNWCAVANEAGYTPIAFGNSTQWPAANNFTDMVALTGGREVGLEVLRGESKWNRPELVDALDRLLQMVEAECFTPGFNGIEYGEALAQFYTGKATAIWTGTRVIHDVVGNTPEGELDIFYFPQIYDDIPQATHMSEGSAYYIWSGTDNPDLAAEYIDFVTSPQWLDTWIEKGSTIPIQKDPIDWDKYDFDPVIGKAFSIGQGMQDLNVDAFHTTVAPNVVQALYQGMQGVLSGETTPEDFLNKMDEETEFAKSQGQVWEPGSR